MQTYVVDTNFFISGFQSNPSTFSIFAKILKKAEIQIVIPTYIKNELRYFVQREILPHVVVEEVDERKFQDFLRKIHEQTASLPQKPDLSVIYVANKLAAPIISSDLKLLETAELLGIKTYTDSAFVRFLLEILQKFVTLYLVQTAMIP
ncbi:MAG: PIN domain-containing protein [Candidatus Heimdallarchaeaceae archaeon]